MPLDKNELIQLVSAKIDEVLPGGDNSEGVQLIEGPVNYIDRELDESANHILRQAPVAMIKQVMINASKHFPVGAEGVPETNPVIRVIYDAATKTAKVPCPTDFLRFVEFQLSTWKTPVLELLRQEDPKYRHQKNNPWTQGSEMKPVAALIGFTSYLPTEVAVGFSNNGFALECFTSKTLPTINVFHYVPKTAAEDMPDDLIQPMVWECAGRTLQIMKRPTEAAAAFQQVMRYFENKFGLYGENK